jgi:protein required for attachment to host cells
MPLRIVVADERQANFFDAASPGSLVSQGSIMNGAAGLKDRDLETDREGRRYGGTSGVSHAGGAAQSHHHGTDGERSTEIHDLQLFAKAVAKRIDHERATNSFDRLVIIASPKVLGLLRKELPKQSEDALAAEIPKDLLHQGPHAILNALPEGIFSRIH